MLGDRAVAIEHIGSTAVPELAAKDVIDVQVLVRQLGVRLDGFDAPFGTDVLHDHVPTGRRGDGRDWEKQFFRRREPRPVNVHVRRVGAANARYALLFRDYLRANEAARRAWEETKRRVAAEQPDRTSYTEVKDALTDELMIEAERWAARVGWPAAR